MPVLAGGNGIARRTPMACVRRSATDNVLSRLLAYVYNVPAMVFYIAIVFYIDQPQPVSCHAEISSFFTAG